MLICVYLHARRLFCAHNYTHFEYSCPRVVLGAARAAARATRARPNDYRPFVATIAAAMEAAHDIYVGVVQIPMSFILECRATLDKEMPNLNRNGQLPQHIQKLQEDLSATLHQYSPLRRAVAPLHENLYHVQLIGRWCNALHSVTGPLEMKTLEVLCHELTHIHPTSCVVSTERYLPMRAGVYVFTVADDAPYNLYVGSTSNLHARFSQHILGDKTSPVSDLLREDPTVPLVFSYFLLEDVVSVIPMLCQYRFNPDYYLLLLEYAFMLLCLPRANKACPLITSSNCVYRDQVFSEMKEHMDSIRIQFDDLTLPVTRAIDIRDCFEQGIDPVSWYVRSDYTLRNIKPILDACKLKGIKVAVITSSFAVLTTLGRVWTPSGEFLHFDCLKTFLLAACWHFGVLVIPGPGGDTDDEKCQRDRLIKLIEKIQSANSDMIVVIHFDICESKYRSNAVLKSLPQKAEAS
jgi:hypothetical protein